MPYGITQYYLPPGRGDIPAVTPAEAGTRLSDPGGMQGWVDLVADYSPRWYTRDHDTGYFDGSWGIVKNPSLLFAQHGPVGRPASRLIPVRLFMKVSKVVECVWL